MLGPKILGEATNIIFEGFVSSQMPAGATQEQVVDELRAAGEHPAGRHGRGDGPRARAGHRLHARSPPCSRWVLALYVLASLFGWAQGYVLNGVTQRTVYRLRQEVEEKIHRLPLSYFDRMQRGELLSRVTNDIDNVSQTAAADDEPAADLAPHRGRRARDDVHHLAAARR